MACGGPNFLRQKQNSMLAYYLSNVTQIFELFKSCFVTFYCTSEDTNPIGEVPYFFFYSNFGILKCEKDGVFAQFLNIIFGFMIQRCFFFVKNL